MPVKKATDEHFIEIINVINISMREALSNVLPQDIIEGFNYTEETFKDYFERMDFVVYLEDSKVIGTAALEIANQAWMRFVYVLPKHQRKGIGKEMVQKIELEAQNKGFKQISLYTFDKFTWAINFYEKQGYTITGTRKNPWGNTTYMEKILSE